MQSQLDAFTWLCGACSFWSMGFSHFQHRKVRSTVFFNTTFAFFVSTRYFDGDITFLTYHSGRANEVCLNSQKVAR
jgi:hypothetical protein